MPTPKAAVLLSMGTADLFDLITTRMRADRHPHDAPVVARLGLIRASAHATPPELYPELMARYWPQVRLRQYARVWRRCVLEDERWEAARAIVGSPRHPKRLTGDSAERLVELIDSWARPDGDGRFHPDDQRFRVVDDASQPAEPHELRPAHEGHAS